MRVFRFLHRWLGITATLFILFFAISGIVLNHRSFFSAADINRKYLPASYHYKNWNLAAVKSAYELSPDSMLVYGNIGIWLTDPGFNHYTPFMQGMRRGTDNRRTTRIVQTNSGQLLAASMSGLYQLMDQKWQPIRLPVKENRITGITQNQDTVWVLTRSHLLTLLHNGSYFEAQKHVLPHPTNFKRETSLFRALWLIHSGKILGLPGKLLVDLMGLIMIFLCLSGIVWFVAPDLMKSLKNRVTVRKRFASLNRFSLKWHNTLGIWTLFFMILLTLTGMFLRPPLLITIIRSKFPAIKHTLLDHPNPWYDKLRDIQFDRLSNQLVLSTSEGFFLASTTFSDSLKRIPLQPPISVMGINVFEQPFDGVFITGSFSGIHRWVPSAMQVNDYITGAPVAPGRGMANPFGSIPVAGYIKMDNGAEYLFDYNAGMLNLQPGIHSPPMPEVIKRNSPMPLWNLALEVHTGRYYSFFLGKYNILFIPVAGLVILLVLISGGIMWARNHIKKKRRKAHSSPPV